MVGPARTRAIIASSAVFSISNGPATAAPIEISIAMTKWATAKATLNIDSNAGRQTVELLGPQENYNY